MKSLIHVQLFATPWTVAYQAPPSMGFSRQEYWSALPLLSLGIFLTPGSNSGLLHCRQTLLPSEPPGYMPRSGIACSYSGFIPSFTRNLHTVFYSGCINLHFHQQCKSSTPSPVFIVCRLFDDGHSEEYEVISHCSYDLHFSNNEQC